MSPLKALLVPLVSLVLLQGVTRAEDYICGDAAGCTARINENGNLTEECFRKGDLVSTEAGWIVESGDGWEKVDEPRWSDQKNEPRPCWCGLIHPPRLVNGTYRYPPPHLPPAPARSSEQALLRLAELRSASPLIVAPPPLQFLVPVAAQKPRRPAWSR